MNGAEAKKLFIKHAGPYLEEWGFKEKKNRTIHAIYIRKKVNGFEKLGISTTNYFPKVVFGMGANKRIDVVENIMTDMNEKLKLELRIDKDTFTLTRPGTGQESALRRLELMEVKDLDKEQGVIDSAKILLRFIKNDVLPTFDFYDDLFEIDKEINGEGEKFRFEDYGNSYVCRFGNSYYFYRRQIIARLCKTDEAFEEFVGRYIKMFNEAYIDKDTDTLVDRNDPSSELIQVINYLKEHVTPLKQR